MIGLSLAISDLIVLHLGSGGTPPSPGGPNFSTEGGQTLDTEGGQDFELEGGT